MRDIPASLVPVFAHAPVAVGTGAAAARALAIAVREVRVHWNFFNYNNGQNLMLIPTYLTLSNFLEFRDVIFEGSDIFYLNCDEIP